MTASDSLAAVTSQLGDDELRVLTFIAQRLLGGATQYGALDLATDRRNFARERGEEIGDMLVYWACEDLKRTCGHKP